MESSWLDDFFTLVQTRNFSRAAAMRNVSQPAFSRRIRALEDWVGAALFFRESRGVTLTPAGEVFHRRAGVLYRGMLDLRSAVREAAADLPQPLRFGATYSLSYTFFARWMDSFPDQARPGQVQLVSDSMRASENALRKGDIQFLLCHCMAGQPALAPDLFPSCRIARDTLLPLARPGDSRFTLPFPDPDHPPILEYDEASGLGRILIRSGIRQRAAAGRGHFSSHLASVLLSMALQGRGVAWLPASLAEKEMADNSLIPVGGPEWSVALEIRLYRSPHSLSPGAEAFWQWLAGEASCPPLSRSA